MVAGQICCSKATVSMPIVLHGHLLLAFAL